MIINGGENEWCGENLNSGWIRGKSEWLVN